MIKLGDTIKITEDLAYANAKTLELRDNSPGVVEDMLRYQGKTSKVVKVLENNRVQLDVDCESWIWSTDWLSPVENPQSTQSDSELLINELTLIYLQKNKDYGNSVEVTRERFGDMATLVRISDKVNRFKTLKTREAEVAESIEDTVKDMINYWGIYKSFFSEYGLQGFIEAITQLVTQPHTILNEMQDKLGDTILDNDTLMQLATQIECLEQN